MNLKPKTQNWCFVFRVSCFVICALCLGSFALLYAQANAKVTVPADVTTETIILNPQNQAPSAPVEGEIYYRDDPDNQLYYHDDDSWEPFGAGGLDKTVATRIVAVQRDPHDEALDSDLTGKTADYICDGTDDQVEIQDAINDCTVGGAVYLLEGTYNISGAISFTADDSGKTIIGAGNGTVLRATSGIDVINAQNVSNILISQLMIDGNNTGNRGIHFDSVTYSKIDKVWAENMSSHGIRLNNSSNNNTLLGNNCQLNGFFGITIEKSSGNTAYGNIFWSNGILGIRISGPASNNTISSNIVYSNNTYGMNLTGTSTELVSNNTISSNIFWSNNADGIYLSDYTYNNTVTGNNIWRNGRHGIYLYNSSNNTISGNNIQSNSQKGIYVYKTSHKNIVSGNVIYDNGGNIGNYDGIHITEGDDNIISSNRIYDSLPASNGGYGINISGSSCDNNYLVGNFIDGAGFTRPINDAGTNTRYTDKVKITLEPAGACPGSGCTGLSAGGTLTPTGPTSYLRLVPAGSFTLSDTTAIANGKSAGDILILENTANFILTINDDRNVQLFNNQPRNLDQNDTLTLIWDNDNTDWIEVGYSHNPPDLF